MPMIVLTGLLCRSHGFATKFPTLGRKKSKPADTGVGHGWMGRRGKSQPLPIHSVEPTPDCPTAVYCWACALPSFIWIENVG